VRAVRKRRAAVIATLLLSPALLRAQIVRSLEIGAESWRDSAGNAQAAMVGGEAAGAWSRLSVDAMARVHFASSTTLAQRPTIVDGAMHAGWRGPTVLGATLRALISAQHFTYDDALDPIIATGRLALDRASPWGSLSAEAGTVRGWSPAYSPLGVEAIISGVARTPAGAISIAWHSARTSGRSIITSAQDSATIDSRTCVPIVVTQTITRTQCTRNLAISEVELRDEIWLGNARFNVYGGVRPYSQVSDNTTSRAWAGASAEIPISATTSAFAAYGSRPADIMRTTISGRQITFGMRFRPTGLPAPHAPTASRRAAATIGRPARDGMRALQLVLQSAGQVEVRGDFTGWIPVVLESRDGIIWKGRFRMDAGEHSCVIRIDNGAWRAPPGTVELDDGFGGVSGVIVAP